MASVTQNIPSYTGGISEQPDASKFPGQVKNIVNGFPNITKGLEKRPGARRVPSDITAGSGATTYSDYIDLGVAGNFALLSKVEIHDDNNSASGNSGGFNVDTPSDKYCHFSDEVTDASNASGGGPRYAVLNMVNTQAPGSNAYTTRGIELDVIVGSGSNGGYRPNQYPENLTGTGDGHYYGLQQDPTTGSSLRVQYYIGDSVTTSTVWTDIRDIVGIQSSNHSGVRATFTIDFPADAIAEEVFFRFYQPENSSTSTTNSRDDYGLERCRYVYHRSSDADGPLRDVTNSYGTSDNYHWFHYYRDSTEGGYVGNIIPNGSYFMWRINDGERVTDYYDVIDGGSLLSPTAAYFSNDGSGTMLDFLTINDTTFVVNKSKTVASLGETPSSPDKYWAYVELQKAANGRQYGLNLYNDDTLTTISTATRLKISSDNLAEGWGSGNCPGVGQQIYSGTETNTGDKKNLTFRIITTGQMGESRTADTDDGSTNESSFRCTYNRRVELLHGGEGWDTDDTTSHDLDQASTTYNYTIKVTGHETYQCKANLKAVRPAPTPFDAETSVGSQTILGQMKAELTGVYPYSIEVDAVSVNDTENKINTGTAQLYAGMKVLYEAGPGGDMGGISNGQYYYIIIHEENWIRLATSYNNALSGTYTTFSANGDNHYFRAVLDTRIIGNGLYIGSSFKFNCETTEMDLMKVTQSKIDDVADLPHQCRHGAIVQVSNVDSSTEADYYIKFVAENDIDGPGSWEECAAPGIKLGLDPATMPHIIQRQADGNFLAKPFTWINREAGDDDTNPMPTFVGKKITKVLYFRNRLAFLSDENVILSKAGSYGDFFISSALAVGATDPVDISSGSEHPSILYNGIEIPAGLLVFSDKQQFLLASDDTVFNPDTAKMKQISSYNYHTGLDPISLGTTVGFVDNAQDNARFFEITNISREADPTIVETSVSVPTLLPKDLRLVAHSKENKVIFFSTMQPELYGFTYFQIADQRQHAAWFKWKLNIPLVYMFIIDEDLYYIDAMGFLNKISLVQSSEDLSITDNGTDYLLHLDNYCDGQTGISRTYDSVNNKTNFCGYMRWATFYGNHDQDSSFGSGLHSLVNFTRPNGKLAVVGGPNAGTDYKGRYALGKIIYGCSHPTGAGSGVGIQVDGDWTGTSLNNLYFGYLYDFEVELPRIYSQKTIEDKVISDTDASLVLHRANFNFGKIGLYETTLKRKGKDDYTQVHESTELNLYNASEAPYLEEKIQTVPIYEKTENVSISIKSTHPAPAVLRSMNWEGDYTPKYYTRV